MINYFRQSKIIKVKMTKTLYSFINSPRKIDRTGVETVEYYIPNPLALAHHMHDDKRNTKYNTYGHIMM
jgi:hypothetical protein